MRQAFEEMDYKATYDNVFRGEYKDIRLENRRVVCAACRKGETILAGARHFDTVMTRQLEAMSFTRDPTAGAEQGFIDQFGCSSIGRRLLYWRPQRAI
jgi:hypothetical protein